MDSYSLFNFAKAAIYRPRILYTVRSLKLQQKLFLLTTGINLRAKAMAGTRTSQEGIFPNDWLLSRVSSWQLERKIIDLEKTHWHNVYTLRTLKRSESKAIQSCQIKIDKWIQFVGVIVASGSEWNVFGVSTPSRDKNINYYFYHE